MTLRDCISSLFFDDSEVDDIITEMKSNRRTRESIGNRLKEEGATVTYKECLSITEGHYLDLPGLKAFRLMVKNNSIVIPTEILPGEHINKHRNDCTKRGLVIRGFMTVNGEKYGAGEFFLIAPLTWHVMKSEEGCVVVFVLLPDVTAH